jgi:hypothetical protein
MYLEKQSISSVESYCCDRTVPIASAVLCYERRSNRVEFNMRTCPATLCIFLEAFCFLGSLVFLSPLAMDLNNVCQRRNR